jgi:hypothetical protein
MCVNANLLNRILFISLMIQNLRSVSGDKRMTGRSGTNGLWRLSLWLGLRRG